MTETYSWTNVTHFTKSVFIKLENSLMYLAVLSPSEKSLHLALHWINLESPLYNTVMYQVWSKFVQCCYRTPIKTSRTRSAWL